MTEMKGNAFISDMNKTSLRAANILKEHQLHDEKKKKKLHTYSQLLEENKVG